MKRFSTALAMIGLTTAASTFAALPATTDPTLVNVPELSGGFVIGLSGYYMEPSPSNGDLDYASANVANPPTVGLFSKLYNVDPGFDTGWGANLGYIFPGTGSDVNLSYFYLDAGNNTAYVNIIPLPFNSITPVTSQIINQVLPFAMAQAFSDHRINQVDFTAGQFIDVGCRLRLHPNLGLRYTSLERKLNSDFGATLLTSIPGLGLINENDAASINEDSDFSGIGPLAGLDASYYIGMGIGAVAHVDGGLLIGNIDSKTDIFASDFSSLNVGPITIIGANNTMAVTDRNDSSRRAVPVADMKLGIDYTYMFNNAANSDLTLEVGYQASEYYHAIDRLITQAAFPVAIVGAGAQVDPTGSTNEIIGRKTSSVALDGLYATLTLHI